MHGDDVDRVHDWDDPGRWPHELLREPALVPVTEALLAAVHARPGQRLLDLACGLGHTTTAAADRGVDALGIDLSETRIAAARARFPHAKFSVADAEAPPAGPWDAVVSRFGAHHLSTAWAGAVLGVLAPGGRLAIAEWPPQDERDREQGKMPAAHWEMALERAGFQDVRVETIIARLPPEAEREVLIVSARKPGRS